MRYDNLGGFKSIDKFVGNKIDALIKSDKSMRSLYELMFSESENVMFEETDGFRIKKTTYGQVKATVEEISPDIRRKVDSDNGSVIGVYMDNCPLMIAVFWAILKAGYKPLLVMFYEMLYTQMCGWIPFIIDKGIGVKMVFMNIVVYMFVSIFEYIRINKVPMDEALKNVE